MMFGVMTMNVAFHDDKRSTPTENDPLTRDNTNPSHAKSLAGCRQSFCPQRTFTFLCTFHLPSQYNSLEQKRVHPSSPCAACGTLFALRRTETRMGVSSPHSLESHESHQCVSRTAMPNQKSTSTAVVRIQDYAAGRACGRRWCSLMCSARSTCSGIGAGNDSILESLAKYAFARFIDCIPRRSANFCCTHAIGMC